MFFSLWFGATKEAVVQTGEWKSICARFSSGGHVVQKSWKFNYYCVQSVWYKSLTECSQEYRHQPRQGDSLACNGQTARASLSITRQHNSSRRTKTKNGCHTNQSRFVGVCFFFMFIISNIAGLLLILLWIFFIPLQKCDCFVCWKFVLFL